MKTCIGRSAALAMAITAMVAASAVHAEEPLVLKPLGRWVMDYADDSCALRRTFGSEADPIWLEFRQYAPGDDFIATVASKAFDSRKLELKTRFLPDGARRDQELAAYADYSDGVEGIIFPDTLRPEPAPKIGEGLKPWTIQDRNERERSITGFHLALRNYADYRLETGELHKPMTAMRACLDDLLQGWGIDPEVDRTLSEEASIKNASMIALELAEMVPSSLVRSGTNARVTLRTIISEAGKMENCKVILPIVAEGFERKLCDRIGKRANILPARDASGKVVRSVYTFSVAYAVTIH